MGQDVKILRQGSTNWLHLRMLEEVFCGENDIQSICQANADGGACAQSATKKPASNRT